MDGPSRTVNPACVQPHTAQANKGLRKNAQLSSSPTTRLCHQKKTGTHCHEWPAEKANTEVQMLVQANNKPRGIVIYTDGSVTRNRSGWWFTVKQGGRTVHNNS